MSENSIDYCELAKRSVSQPLLALYACCPNCGGDVGLHEGLARLLDTMYKTGVKFCQYNGKDCENDHDACEWVWTRYFSMKGRALHPLEIDLQTGPVFFKIAA